MLDDVTTASKSDDFQTGCSVEVFVLPLLQRAKKASSGVYQREGAIVGTAPLRQRQRGRTQPTPVRSRPSFALSLLWLATASITKAISRLRRQLRGLLSSDGRKRLQCGSRVRWEIISVHPTKSSAARRSSSYRIIQFAVRHPKTSPGSVTFTVLKATSYTFYG